MTESFRSARLGFGSVRARSVEPIKTPARASSKLLQQGTGNSDLDYHLLESKMFRLRLSQTLPRCTSFALAANDGIQKNVKTLLDIPHHSLMVPSIKSKSPIKAFTSITSSRRRFLCWNTTADRETFLASIPLLVGSSRSMFAHSTGLVAGHHKKLASRPAISGLQPRIAELWSYGTHS